MEKIVDKLTNIQQHRRLTIVSTMKTVATFWGTLNVDISKVIYTTKIFQVQETSSVEGKNTERVQDTQTKDQHIITYFQTAQQKES
jgi:hypothetical protein